jgi:hypothetical protein
VSSAAVGGLRAPLGRKNVGKNRRNLTSFGFGEPRACGARMLDRSATATAQQPHSHPNHTTRTQPAI